MLYNINAFYNNGDISISISLNNLDALHIVYISIFSNILIFPLYTIDISVSNFQVRETTIFAFDSKQFANQDPNQDFASQLSQYPLRFSFQDGVVESICPHAEEKTWAVNIKRGILSAIQNSMDNFDLDFKGVEVRRFIRKLVISNRNMKYISNKSYCMNLC